MEVQGQKADFRIHANKGRDGKWKVTAIACKVGGVNSPTTHTFSGGIVKTMAEIFPERSVRLNITKKLLEAALSISNELDRKLKGHLAEIGFDMGIDRDGNVWLFEANSKPGRAIFQHPDLFKFERHIQK